MHAGQIPLDRIVDRIHDEAFGQLHDRDFYMIHTIGLVTNLTVEMDMPVFNKARLGVAPADSISSTRFRPRKRGWRDSSNKIAKSVNGRFVQCSSCAPIRARNGICFVPTVSAI